MSFDLKIVGRDLGFGPTKDLAIVENSEKLIQDVLKIVLTQIGSNPFFPWYGSPITRSLIGTAFEERFVSAVASNQLRTALETLQNLQKEQLKQSQIVTPQEQIAAVQNVIVERNVLDPRFYSVQLTVLNKAFRRVQTGFDVNTSL